MSIRSGGTKLAALIAATAFSLPALAQTPSRAAAVEAEPNALPVQGTIMQAGKVVAWASGAALEDRTTIRFEKISQAYNFQQSQSFDYGGYTLSVVRVYQVRYPSGDPAAGTTLEYVVAQIRGRAAR